MKTRAGMIGLVIMVLAAQAILAADTQPATMATVNPVKAILERMGSQFQSPQSFSVTLQRVWRVTGDGYLLQYTTGFEAAREAPNRFAIVAKTGFASGSFSSDGQQLTISEPKNERFESVPISQTFQYKDVQNKLAQFSPVSPTTSFMLCLFSDDPAANLLAEVTEAKVVAKETLDGKPAVHLSFAQEEVAWDLWLSDTPQPLPLKMVANLRGNSDTQTIGVKNMQSQWETVFSQFQFGQDIPDDLFVLNAPQRTSGVEAASNYEEGEESALIGKSAPDLSLPLLAGGTMNLGDHRGQQVVVLDFFATWCPPCLASMPIFQKVANEYSGKNVRFYAVDLSEEKDLVEKFVKEANVGVAVLLDVDGSAGRAYEALLIPQTVVIDKSGIVRDVSVGIIDEKSLKTTLDDVLQE